MGPFVTKYDIDIKDQKGCENQIVDHLSRLEDDTHIGEHGQIKEEFLDEKLFELGVEEFSCNTDTVNYIMSGVFPSEANNQQK